MSSQLLQHSSSHHRSERSAEIEIGDGAVPSEEAQSKKFFPSLVGQTKAAVNTTMRVGADAEASHEKMHSNMLYVILAIALLVTGLALIVASIHYAQQTGLAQDSKQELRGGVVVEVQIGEAFSQASVPGALVGIFESHASMHASATALTDVETEVTVTYGELAKLCQALETALRQAGLSTGDVVGLLFEPSCCFIVATMGVMRAGACWLPLDLKSPSERLQQLLARVGTRLVLATRGWPANLVAPLPVWALKPHGELCLAPGMTVLRPSLGVACAPGTAAIFYTSGSTGEPKGVMYGPETLCHGALAFDTLCSADSTSTFLVKTPTIWAVTEYEVFAPLAVGAHAVVDARAQRDPMRLSRTVREYGVSILVTSAPVLQLLLDERLPSLRHAVNVGAALPLEVLSLVERAFGTHLLVHNLYGATETPCLQWTGVRAEAPLNTALAPAGVPQPGTEVHLLGEGLQPVAEGSVGEVCIGGPYLSHGYFGDKRLTEERFLPSPTGQGRIYRTGDVGRWLREPGGRLVLQVEGRLDRQLNIRGVRVAPEEIEAVLSQAPGVREAAVVVTGEEGLESVVACVTGEAPSFAAGVELRVRSHLPLHMRPKGLLLLDELPRLGNGKVDLASLTKTASAEVRGSHAEDVEALDSLGRMRRVKRQFQRDLEIAASIRMWAMVAVIIYHYYWEHWVDYGYDDRTVLWWLRSQWDAQGSALFRAIVEVGFGILPWTMPVYITLSGYLDSAEGAKSKLTENSISLLLFLACYWPIPQIFLWVFQVPLGNGDVELKFLTGGHRWYLIYYILCNVLHSWVFLPLRMSLEHATPMLARTFPAAVTMTIAALCYCVENFLSIDRMCGELPPRGFKLLVLQWILPRVVPPNNNVHHWQCMLVLKSELNLFVIYAIGWWFGPPLIKSVREAPFGRWLVWLGVVLPASLFALVAGAYQPPLTRWSPDAYRDLMGFVCCYLAIWCAILVADKSWYPLHAFARLGNCTMATYIFHPYFIIVESGTETLGFFRFKSRAFIPSPEDAVAAIGGWPGSDLMKLLLLLSYPLVFMATFGQLFQAMMFAIPLLAGSVGSWLLRGWSWCWSWVRYPAPSASSLPRSSGLASSAWERLRSEIFDAGGVACLDGGTGSELERRATRDGSDMAAVNHSGWSCLQWKTHPELLRDVHLSYLHSGASIIISNSYATNRHVMKAAGFEDLTVESTLTAVRLACEARDHLVRDKGSAATDPPLVAGSMSCHPPGMAHGASMDKGQWPPREAEYAAYLEQADLLRKGGADIIFVEMIWEWKDHGLLAARGACASGLPVALCLAVFDSSSCEEGMPQLHDGTLVEEVARVVSRGDEWENVVAICVHHTKLPMVLPCLSAIRRGGWDGVVGAYPDHGTFEMPHWRFEPLEARKILEYIEQWVKEANCQMVGGCCGIGPETIQKIGGWCQAYNSSKSCKAHVPTGGGSGPAALSFAADASSDGPATPSEMAVDGSPLRAAQLPVLVLGAGLSGLAAARECQKRGYRFVLVDRQRDLGGCWKAFGNRTSKLQSDSGSYDVDLQQHHCLPTYPCRDDLMAYIKRWFASNKLGEHAHFGTELQQVEPAGDSATYTVHLVEGTLTRSLQVCAVLAAPGRLGRPVKQRLPGEDAFQGRICYGISDDIAIAHLAGREAVVLGHGSFAIENMRTCLEHGATKVTMICRTRNLVLPRAVRLVISKRVSGVQLTVEEVLDLCNPAYQLIGLDCRSLSSVSASQSGALMLRQTQPSVSDLYFLAQWSGGLEVLVDSISCLTDTAVCTEASRREVRADTLIKCLGFETANPDFDRVMGLERMVGLWVNGDRGRFVLQEPVGKFSFSKWPIPYANPHYLYLWYFFRAFQDGFLESLRHRLPTCLTSAYDCAHSEKTFGALLSALDATALQELMALQDLPARRTWEAHPWERFLAEQRAEWEAYSQSLGVRAPVYPYRAEVLERAVERAAGLGPERGGGRGQEGDMEVSGRGQEGDMEVRDLRSAQSGAEAPAAREACQLRRPSQSPQTCHYPIVLQTIPSDFPLPMRKEFKCSSGDQERSP